MTPELTLRLRRALNDMAPLPPVAALHRLGASYSAALDFFTDPTNPIARDVWARLLWGLLTGRDGMLLVTAPLLEIYDGMLHIYGAAGESVDVVARSAHPIEALALALCEAGEKA